MTSELDGIMPKQRNSGVLAARLLIGLIVLICAEVFSGASLQIGLWHPWTWIVTYWLYLAHFFFFTTLAVRTGRTSLWSLYLWGVLYGLYESWITKVREFRNPRAGSQGLDLESRGSRELQPASEKIRLIIQIPAFLEILISCFLRSNKVKSS